MEEESSMTASLRLGRIAGIPIGASWSVLLIALLVGWPLAGTVLPGLAPGLAPSAYVLAGAVATGLFLGSLLAHELGHALVARRAGLRVRGITLWLLGGVAQLEDEPASPRDDLRVAVVGPAVSLALAVGFGMAAAVLGLLGAPAIATVAAGWLAVANVVLAVFNLVPAAPLDGGRVLRALLWRRHGNRTRAAVTAANAGQVAGGALIAYGLLGALTGWGIGTLWTVLVGWFLVGAARQERELTVVRHDLAGLRVGDVMTPTPVLAPAWYPVDTFLRDLVAPWRPELAGRNGRPAALPLRGFDGRPAGVVTMAALESVPVSQRHAVRAGDLAVPAWAVAVARPDEPVSALLERLRGGSGIAVVVDGGQLVGLVTRDEVVRAVRYGRRPVAQKGMLTKGEL
jgi:Zn-dependent protease